MPNALLNAATKAVRSIDRIWNGSSAVVRLERRAAALDILPETRHAAYPLAWLVDTGRISAEIERALLDMPARSFAAKALEIAASGASVSACADAWKAAARTA